MGVHPYFRVNATRLVNAPPGVSRKNGAVIRVGVAPSGAIEIAVVTLHQTDGMRPVTAIESDHGVRVTLAE